MKDIMNTTKTFLLTAFLCASNMTISDNQFLVDGILPSEIEGRISPVYFTALSGPETIIPQRDESSENSPETINDRIRNSSSTNPFNPFIIDLRKKENKTSGHFNVDQKNIDVITSIAQGNAALLEVGEIPVIVIDSKKPDAEACKNMRYQVLLLQLEEEHQKRENRLKNEKITAYLIGGTTGVSLSAAAFYAFRYFAPNSVSETK